MRIEDDIEEKEEDQVHQEDKIDFRGGMKCT